MQTNVSKNALIGDGSRTLGATDSNIANGITAEKCANDILKAMSLKIAETTIGGNVQVMQHYLMVLLPQSIIDRF